MLFLLSYHSSPDLKKSVIAKLKPAVRKGSYVICPNNHAVAYVTRDIYRGETNYSTAFDYLIHQPVPVKGQITDPVCYCGESWFALQGRYLTRKPITTLRVENEESENQCL